jgi:hypothetical protein
MAQQLWENDQGYFEHSLLALLMKQTIDRHAQHRVEMLAKIQEDCTELTTYMCRNKISETVSD